MKGAAAGGAYSMEYVRMRRGVIARDLVHRIKNIPVAPGITRFDILSTERISRIEYLVKSKNISLQRTRWHNAAILLNRIPLIRLSLDMARTFIASTLK